MSVQTPPFGLPLLDARGRMVEGWQRFFLALQSAIPAGVALVTQGGTERTSLTAHRLLVGAGTSPVGSLAIGTAGQSLISNGAGVDPAFKTFAATQTDPSDPTGTTDLGGVMMGIGASVTPVVTGRVLITVTGTIANASAIADGANARIRIGVGSAPANGDALAGTAKGGLVKYVAATTAQKAPFTLSALVSGLTLAVAVWIDLSLAAVVGGTATVKDLSVQAVEV